MNERAPIPQIGATWLRDLTPYHYYLDHQPPINGPSARDAALGDCAAGEAWWRCGG